MKMFRKADILFLLVLITLTFGGLLYSFRGGSDQVDIVQVRVAGELYKTIRTPGTYEIRGKDGKVHSIVHFDGKVAWVTNSDCPLKICEKTGKVGGGGKIICVPNKIVIEVGNTREKQDIQTW
ncbi:NusG domain II-containing protein [Thermosipho ferrireducens]|uniref:NusG domain II-containing protein n=1 Tax=Thermosipho ferrireducens TaxID=2571116 RepID=A0ABX7SBD3_9BACT|nr:NusG domain II-containing protein [Thermosipho ferrireducens]QTA38838.1 NusG domain II-containing protein [Thermosipho ferrireducens]